MGYSHRDPWDLPPIGQQDEQIADAHGAVFVEIGGARIGWIGAAAYAPNEISGLTERLQELRKQEGREHLPFDIMFPIAATPSPDLYRRLEDQGVTSTTSSPFSYSVGPRSTLDQKRRLLEDYAENVIRKMK